MIKRYEARLYVWDRWHGGWTPRLLGTFGTAARAEKRLAREGRYYTRFERHPDFGEVHDVKRGKTYDVDLNHDWTRPTVGDLGWTP